MSTSSYPVIYRSVSGFGVIKFADRQQVFGAWSHFPLPKKNQMQIIFYFLKNLAHCDRICQTVIL
jgi:hypothetical protein